MRAALKVFFFTFLPIYLCFLASVFLFQRYLLYHPSAHLLKNPVYITSMFKKVSLHTHDGLNLTAWYAPAKKSKPTLLYLQGNAGNIEDRLPVVMPYIQTGWGVLLVEYRGYAGNPGKVSEAGFYQDADAAWSFLMKQHVNVSCTVFYGESLGTGVAVELAVHHPPGALILQSAFTSIPDIAQLHYFFLPAYWLVRDRYDSFSKIKKIKAPIIFIHGNNDIIVPIKYGKKLYQAANQPKAFIEISGGGHDLSNARYAASKAIPWLNDKLSQCR